MIRLVIKEICEEKGISRNELSHLSRLDIKTVRRMFDKPQESFSTYALDSVAYALDMEPHQLYVYTRGDHPISLPRKKPQDHK